MEQEELQELQELQETEAAPQLAPTPSSAPSPEPTPGSALLPLTAAALAAAALAACGGSGGDASASPSPTPAPSPPAPTPAPTPAPAPSPYSLDPADTAAARFLQHAQVACTEADIAAVKSQGLAAWLEAQMARPVTEKAYDWLIGKGYGAIDDFRFYDGGGYAISFVIGHQMVKQPDTVRKRIALALSEMFVVSVNVAGVTWPHLGLAHYWDQLNANAFGNFRQLLEDVTLNPVMGAWLNTRGNAKEDPATGRVPWTQVSSSMLFSRLPSRLPVC